jgi:hypothetical protein
VQPNIGQQAVVQAYFKEVVEAWSDYLSADQRRRWGEYAAGLTWLNKLGLRWSPTGYLAFVKLGVESMNLVGSYQLEPPVAQVNVYAATITVIQVGFEPGSLSVEIAMGDWAGAVEPDVMQVWRAGPFDGGGYHATSGEFRVVQVVGTPFSWEDNTVEAWKYYWYRLRWGLDVGIVGVMNERQVFVIEAPPP